MRDGIWLQALQDTYLRDHDSIVSVVSVLGGAPRIDAQDALQTAVWRVLAGSRRGRHGRPVRAWRPYLVRAALNALRDERAKKARLVLFSELTPEEREKLFALPDPRPTPAEQAERNELAALAWEELSRLPEHERAVIVRRCCGQSFREIARALRLKPSTARGFWSKGIARLRAQFREAA